MAYDWYLLKIDMSILSGKENLRTVWWPIGAPEPENGYIDDFWTVKNNNIIQAQGTLSPELWSYGTTTSVKKLGSMSYIMPYNGSEDGIILDGFVYNIQLNDILEVWFYADETWIGALIGTILNGLYHTKEFYTKITAPPIPPPTFSPDWKTQIGPL